MDSLKQILISFKEITESIIRAIKKDDLDSLEVLFKERQNKIDSMDKMVYSKDEFKTIYKELGLSNIEESLHNAMEDKRSTLRQDITKFSETRVANKTYLKKNNVDSIFFNKKI